ncbi:MAG: UbiD family decarboxylase, partial [Thaumarchaeota archaeon]|nr:UbiD family decarboxylase [Nitrososphaerota archaeon]
ETTIDYEPTAYCQLLREKNPMIWFKKLHGFEDFSIVTNELGSEERMAFALGCRTEQLYDCWDRVLTNSGKISISSRRNPPVKERVFEGKDVDLFSLPAAKHYLRDGANSGNGRYITSGLVVSRNPLDHEIINMSFTRIQVIDKTRYAFDMGSRSHFWRYVQIATETESRLPISVIVGAHPIYYMLAAAFIENEYEKAANVVGSEYTIGHSNDIPIPAGAEIVIEAEVLPHAHYDEGPFSEFTGYMARRSTGNVAEVKSILRKNKAIFYDISPSNSNEHVGLFSVPRNAAIIRALREFIPSVPNYKIEWPKSASHFMVLCSLDKPAPGLAKEMGLALLALDPLFSKIVIVNDGMDVDLSLERLLCNLAVQGAVRGENVDIISDVFCIKLDPSSDSSGTNGKMMILTKSSSTPYSKIVQDEDTVRILAGDCSVVLSHRYTTEGTVNVILDRDIDLRKPNEVLWAFSTRLRPDKDIAFEDNGKIIFRATKEGLEIPVLPEQVLKSVKDRIRKTQSLVNI